MDLKREDVKRELEQMPMPVIQDIVNHLRGTRQEYLISTTQVSFPQFFYACYKHVFDDLADKDLNQFKEIDDPNVFVDYSIYYMMKYLKRNRK